LAGPLCFSSKLNVVFALVFSAAIVVAIQGTPAPAPTNPFPFTLGPLPNAASVPIIGTTRSRPVCTAIRLAVKPALEAAMKNDTIYSAMRKTIFDYVVRDNDAARDLRIVQMDKQIADLVRSTSALDDATKSISFRPAPSTRTEDAKTLRELQGTLAGVLDAQRVQLDALSGFVETERARLFGRSDESVQQSQRATAPTGQTGSTPSPVTGFLADSQHTLVSQHPTPVGLSGAHMLDRDLDDISVATTKREQSATRAIIAAAGQCR